MRVIAVLLGVLCVSAAAMAEPGFERSFIFPPQEQHCHSSTIVELPNGDLLAAWFQGSGERTADDVRILGARMPAGGGTWGPVFEMADIPNQPDCNPVLFLDEDERLWLFWSMVVANTWESCLLTYRHTTDWAGPGAPEWDWQGVIIIQPGEEFPEQLRAGFDEVGFRQSMWAEYARPYDRLLVEAARDKAKRRAGWMTRGHVLTLPGGRMLLPLYSDGFNISLTAYSDDAGETWQASAPIVGLGPIQPSIAQKADGTLVAYMRDSGPRPKRVLRATSEDAGETWSVARDTDLAGSSSSVQVCVLEDGRWVLLHNDVEHGRHRLAISMSADEGATWPWKRHLVDEPEDAGRYSYPSVIQTRDGMVHVTYSHHEAERTIAHVVVDPDWIAAGE